MLRCAPIDPRKQIAELRWADRQRPVRSRGPEKPASFKPLREQALPLSVVPKNFHQIAAPSAKNKKMTGVRVVLEHLLNQQGQALVSLAHVGVASRQPNSRPAWDRDGHRPVPSRASARAIARAGATPSGKRRTRPLRSTTSIIASRPPPFATTVAVSAPVTIATGMNRAPSAGVPVSTPLRAWRRHK